MSKKLGKLKLNVLSLQSLEQKIMNDLRGGITCYCSCNGYSSSNSNMNANYNIGDNGGYSTSGCNAYVAAGSGSMECLTCNEENSGYPLVPMAYPQP